MSTVCLDTDSRHDVRLHRLLNGYEFRSFWDLVCFAAEGGDPAFISARRARHLRQELRLSEDQYARRLAKWAKEGVELIEIQESGGILITYLVDREDGASAAYAPDGAAANGHEMNGQGANGQGPERRQRRRYSTTPEADRAYKKYHRDKDAEEGPGREVSAENLTPGESKPHAMSLGFEPEDGQNLTPLAETLREVFPPRVSPNVNVSSEREFINSPDSGDVNVGGQKPHAENLTQNLTQNLTAPPPENPTPPRPAAPAQATPSPAAPSPATPSPAAPSPAAPSPAAPSPAALVWPGGRPPLRPGFEGVDLDMQRRKDLGAAAAITGDHKSGRYWRELWSHCQQNGSLVCWDMALEQTAQDMKSYHEPIQKPGGWFQNIVRNMLRDNGCPMPEGTEEERAAAKAEAAASLLTAGLPPDDTPPEGPPVAGPAVGPQPPAKALARAAPSAPSAGVPPGGGITPLGGICTEGDAHA